MHDRDVAAIEPIAREIEVRAETDFEPEDVAIKVAGRFEIVGLDSHMVQGVERHGVPPSRSVEPSETIRQDPRKRVFAEAPRTRPVLSSKSAQRQPTAR